ncbi:MAG: MATE family efflux transporter [Lachnospiraceae bacterium]|nr:MATE family efflux transporter [Lachnospiraceae bacterium]
MSGNAKEMTSGSPTKLILGFAVPLLFGYLFQQFYSLVDSMIVGQVLGKDALAAVGSTGAVNFLIVGFCMGLCSGFAIPVAQRFGAREYSMMRRFVANCVWLSVAFSVVFTVIVCVLCRNILIWMQTPENIMEGAYEYIFIIFAGIPTAILYNLMSGILRSMGESKVPLVFLIISSVINIVLDLLFLIVFKTGVKGAAIATVIAQFISGVACVIYSVKKYELLHIKKEEWKLNPNICMILCSMGVPMGLQYSITAIGSVILQTSVNTLGSDAVAAITAANKVAFFMCCPYDALGATMATYGGQNVGAKKLERLWPGLLSASLLGFAYCLLALAMAFTVGGPLAGLFLGQDGAYLVPDARMFLIITVAFHPTLVLVNVVRFMIQGMGFPNFAILAGVMEMIARVLVGIWIVPPFGFYGAAFASPLAWVLADAFLVPAFFHCRKKLFKLLGESKATIS